MLRWNADPIVKWRAPLGAGDLLVMRGDVQARLCVVRRASDFQHRPEPIQPGGSNAMLINLGRVQRYVGRHPSMRGAARRGRRRMPRRPRRPQAHWMHSLPRRAGVPSPRVNLTFRRIVKPQAPAA